MSRNVNQELLGVFSTLISRLENDNVSKVEMTEILRSLHGEIQKIEEYKSQNNLSEEEEMTIKEENARLKDALQEIFNTQPRMITTVITGPDEQGLYRVKSNDSDMAVKVNPQLELKGDIKEGTEVIVSANTIEQLLPKPLEVPIEKVDFDRVEWSDIRGLKSQVERIRRTVESPLKHKKLYKAYNLNPSKGILLYGVPGVGKTMIAKAIATYIIGKKADIRQESFIYLKGGEMLSKFVGEAENNIKNLFERCRKHYQETGTRSVIFLDEAEALLPTRGSRKSSDVETTIVPTFLAEMDGLNKNSPFIILASNYPEQIDPAIQRPGRIDLKVKITRPNREDCLDILELYFSKTLCKDSIEDLCRLTVECIFSQRDAEDKVSGAVLKNVVDEIISCSIDRVVESNSQEYGITVEDVRSKFLLSGI